MMSGWNQVTRRSEWNCSNMRANIITSIFSPQGYLSELKKAIALAEEQIAKGREVMEGEREDLADIAGTPRQK